MYVCICQGVTDKQIHNAICNGACSMRELRECLGITKQCGKCGRSTREVLKKATDNARSTTPATITC